MVVVSSGRGVGTGSRRGCGRAWGRARRACGLRASWRMRVRAHSGNGRGFQITCGTPAARLEARSKRQRRVHAVFARVTAPDRAEWVLRRGPAVRAPESGPPASLPEVAMTRAPCRPLRTRPPPRRVEVSRVTRLTPRMLRVTFTGPELEGFATQGPATHVKLFLPPEGEREPLLPTFGPQGLTWPDGPRPIVRTYTPRAFHPASGRAGRGLLPPRRGPGNRLGGVGRSRDARRDRRPGKELLCAGGGRTGLRARRGRERASGDRHDPGGAAGHRARRGPAGGGRRLRRAAPGRPPAIAAGDLAASRNGHRRRGSAARLHHPRARAVARTPGTGWPARRA